MNVTADDVLDLLIRVDVEISPYTKIVSVPTIARYYEITKYRARKLIEELKERGMVQSDMESVYSDYFERHFICRGYVLTKKARHTQEWHHANIRELSLLGKCFNMDMGKSINDAVEAAERDKHHEQP